MSDLKTEVIVICSSRLALPAIFYLHSVGKLSCVLSCTRDFEFEEELTHHSKQFGFSLISATKHNWKEKLSQLMSEKNPEIVLVKTFSYKIPEAFLNIPKHGFINFHYALLPEKRGAFPLFNILKNREEYGGVTVHKITNELDAGPMLYKSYININPPETYAKHANNLGLEGARLTKQLIEHLSDEGAELKFITQDESLAKTIHKPTSKELTIKWDVMSIDEIVALVLASNGWSKGAITNFHQLAFSILYARKLNETHSGIQPGTILSIRKGEILKIAGTNSEIIGIDIVHTPFGYLPGFELSQFGIIEGNRLGV